MRPAHSVPGSRPGLVLLRSRIAPGGLGDRRGGPQRGAVGEKGASKLRTEAQRAPVQALVQLRLLPELLGLLLRARGTVLSDARIPGDPAMRLRLHCRR